MSNIKNQMGSAVNKINEKNPSFLLAGIFTVILVVFYLFPLQFQLKTLQAINPKLEELNRETTETRNNILRVTQYKKELSRLEEKYQNLQRRIKRKEDIPFLLENISRIADKHGVKIEQKTASINLAIELVVFEGGQK